MKRGVRVMAVVATCLTTMAMTAVTATPSFADTSSRVMVTRTWSSTTCSNGSCTNDGNTETHDLGEFSAPDGATLAIDLERTPEQFTNTAEFNPPDCPGGGYTDTHDIQNVAVYVVARSDSTGEVLSRTRVFGGFYSEGTTSFHQEEYGRSQQTQQCEGPSIYTADATISGGAELVPMGSAPAVVHCSDGRTLDEADVNANVQLLQTKFQLTGEEETAYRADPCQQVSVTGDVAFEPGEGQEVAGTETATTAGDGAPTGSDGTYRVTWAWNWKLVLNGDVKAAAGFFRQERVISPKGGVVGAVAASYEYDMIKKDGAWDGYVYNVSRQSLRSFNSDLQGLETQLKWTGPTATNDPPAGYGGAGSTDKKGRTWRTQFTARAEVAFGAGVGPLSGNASFVVVQLPDTAEAIFFGDEPRARITPAPFESERNTYTRYSTSTTPPQ